MSLQLSLAQKQPPTVGNQTFIIAELEQTYPPYGYYYQYEFELSAPMEQGTFRLIENYSIDNVLHFTSLELGEHLIRATAKLFPEYTQEVKPEIDASISQTFSVAFTDNSQLKAPSCLPIEHGVSPLYHTPVLQSDEKVRLMVIPELAPQKQQFTPPITLLEPSELTFKHMKSCLPNGVRPPIKLIHFTSWTDANAAEMYLPIVGMAAGQIYSLKHEIKQNDKKLELKNKISYETENNEQSSIKLTPLFLSEYKDRSFYVLADNLPHGDALQGSTYSLEDKKSEASQSVLLSSFGLPLAELFDKEDSQLEQMPEQQTSILETNGEQLFCLTSSVNSQVFEGYNLHTSASIDQLAEDLKKQCNENFKTSRMFLDERAIIATSAGVPLRQIDIASINNFLYQEYCEDVKKALDNPESVKQPPKFRPLLKFTNFEPLESSIYLVAGLAEEQLNANAFLYESVSSIIKSQKIKLNSDEMSLLTAVVLLVKPDGEVISKIYISDLFPNNINTFEFVKLTTPGSSNLYNLPGFFHEDAVVHSAIYNIDATAADCIIALPRQDAIIRLDFINFVSHQETTFNNEDIDLSKIKEDIIIYTKTKPICHLAAGFRVILGEITPIDVARISNRMYILCNTVSGVELFILRLPKAMPNGARDMNEILQYESECLSSQNEEADEAYFTEVKKQMSEKQAATDTTDEEIGFEIKILERIMLEKKAEAADGNVIGLLKGGCVVSWKYQNVFRIVEIKSGSCAYACAVEGASHLRLQRSM